jgi:hypothetical protein
MNQSNCHRPLLTFYFASIITANLYAADTEADLGPDGVTRIIVEAEDMHGVDRKRFGASGTNWRVGRAGIDHYQNNTFGGHWQSRGKTAMTDASDSPAEIEAHIIVPKAGIYRLWVKYECPPLFNYAFNVRLKKGLKTLMHKTFGLRQSSKHFCFNKGMTYGDQYWGWGIDHDAAEGVTVHLPAGRLRLILGKTANPSPAGARSIDAIMITDDLSEISAPRYDRYPLLDELRRANHVFIRYRLGKDAPGPARMNWNRWGKRYPDFYRPWGKYLPLVRFYSKEGQLLRDDKGEPLSRRDGQLAEPLSPGQTSIWLDVGSSLNVESAATFIASAELVDEKGKALKEQPDYVPLAMDIALAPEAKAIVKSFETTEHESALTFLLQPDLDTDEGIRFSRKLIDVYRDVATELNEQPRRGPVPQRMRFISHTGNPGGYGKNREWGMEVAIDFRRALGLNTISGPIRGTKKETIDKEKAYLKKHNHPILRGGTYQHSKDPDKVAEEIKKLGTVDDFWFLSYGDEIGLPAVDVSDPEVIKAFHTYLKKRNLTPKWLGIKDWDTIKPLSSFSADVAIKIGVLPAGKKGKAVDQTLKRLYWHSSQFRIEQGIADFVNKTNRLRELLGNQVHTSANLGGMHPFYWMHQSSFIEGFKHNAMTVAWSEDYDYCQPETSCLVVEFQAGYIKAGTKYNGQRMMWYCMPHYPGQSPEHLEQNTVLLWGQGVKDIDWFSTPPDGFTTENYVNFRGGIPTFRTMRKMTEVAGTVEEFLEPAKPLQARVALLLSEASDVWEIGGLGQWAVTPTSDGTNAFQEERKNTYYALRNAGYLVDLVTESDVRDGLLKPYRALYVGGENLERATAPAIIEWVQSGGTLYASAGAARKDEHDEPLAALDAILGRGKRKAYHRYKGALRSKLELLFLKPLDKVQMNDGKIFDAIATRETFAPAKNATTLATWADGTPAFVSTTSGTGRGYYIGAMPAAAWAKSALPVVPMGKGGPVSNSSQFEPVDFDPIAGNAILTPLREAGILPEVSASIPNITCNVLSSEKGLVITVVNLGHNRRGPVTNVTLTLQGLKTETLSDTAWSWAYRKPEGVKLARSAKGIEIALPTLKITDVIVIEVK